MKEYGACSIPVDHERSPPYADLVALVPLHVVGHAIYVHIKAVTPDP